MSGLTVIFGAILIALGLIGYFATGRQSMTALIPAFAGVVFVLLGFIARRPGARKHAMHIAVALAVLGMLGTVRGLINLFRLFGGAELERPAAAWSQGVMFLLCLIYLILAVQSFLAARRSRAGGFDVTPPAP